MLASTGGAADRTRAAVQARLAHFTSSQFHTVVTQQQKCTELEYTHHRNAHLLDQGYHLREVPAHKVLTPIPARLNAHLANFARQLDHKLSMDGHASAIKWIVDVYPSLLRAFPFQEM